MVARKTSFALQDLDINDLRKNIPANLPNTIKQRIEQIGADEPEARLRSEQSKNIINALTRIPYGVYKPYNQDCHQVRELLDKYHYGFHRVKDSIIEHLLASKYKINNHRLPYFCFYGKPGIGKSSFCHSLAKALDTESLLISLPGRHSFSLIGQERSYRSASYGDLVRSLMESKCMNPIIIFDELDKMNTDDLHGSMESALLSICDPVLNKSFRDLFLDTGIDISKVSFLFTANDPEKISQPLRSRLVMVEVEDYEPEEKVAILHNYLLPTILRDYKPNFPLHFSYDACQTIVDYKSIDSVSKEPISGVREIKSFTTQVINKGLYYLEQHKLKNLNIDCQWIMRNFPQVMEKYQAANDIKVVPRNIQLIGTAYAIAVYGNKQSRRGMLNFVTARLSAGSGQIDILGQVSGAVRESIKVAFSLIKIHSRLFLGDQESVLRTNDIIISHHELDSQHDGGSAGMVYFITMLSELLRLPLSNSLAFSGCIELDGSITAVGMINEKIQGCIEANLSTVYVSAANSEAIYYEYQNLINIVAVRNIFELIYFVFPDFSWHCNTCGKDINVEVLDNYLRFKHYDDLFCEQETQVLL